MITAVCVDKRAVSVDGRNTRVRRNDTAPEVIHLSLHL